MGFSETWLLSISEASKLIANKELSPVEVISDHLSRIDETEGKLNSFITLLRDQSIKAAEDAEQAIQSGNYLGPLHGIPIGLKDLFYTKDIPTTLGSEITRDFVPGFDAAVVGKLTNAGAIIIGKLQMHEFALGITSENPHYGNAHNPWDTERVTGGSSGGSASAVASGQCMGAMGSDTGGSIRIPSSLCGIVGLKPTFGRVSRHGVHPLCWSMDTAGPMARTVGDVALILNTIAGHDPSDPSSSAMPNEDFTTTLERGVKGTRIGIPREYFFDVIDPEIKNAVLQAAHVLEGLGAIVDQVSIPVLNHSLSISGPILGAEAAEIHLENLRWRAADISPDVLIRLQLGALTPATLYLKAQRARTAFNQQIAHVMQRFDILLTPTEPITAPKIGQKTVQVGKSRETPLALLPRLTRPFNVCGVPVISIPCGFTSLGLPIGLQLSGRPFDEPTVLRVANTYQMATDWHTRRPPV